MGFIDFTNGEVLTADQMDLVMRQGIMRFADASARDTALSAVLAEGMMAYLDDTDEVLKYDGTDWIDISGDITGVTAGTALTGGGTSGDVTLDVDEAALTIAQSQVTDLVSDLDDKQDDVITTQGDLVIGDASGDPVRLPVGAADTVLTSDGTTLSFEAAGGGGFPSYTLITSGTVSDETFSITSIPATYDDLLLRFDLSNNLNIRINDINLQEYRSTNFSQSGSLTPDLRSDWFLGLSYGEILFPGYSGNIENFSRGIAIAKGRNATGAIFSLASKDNSIPSISQINSTTSTTGNFQLYGVTYA